MMVEPLTFALDTSHLNGVQFVAAEWMTETVEDWSRVRSPSRARRRRAMGHRQNIRFVNRPRKDALRLPGGQYMMHLETLAAVNAALDKMTASFDKATESFVQFGRLKAMFDENA